MLETGVNILNLPLISNFVNYAIGMFYPLIPYASKNSVLTVF